MQIQHRNFLSVKLVCLYPILSTFLMTMVWQVTQFYYKPFLGGYYFKWMHLYTVDNANWLSGSLKTQSQVLFSVYLFSYILLSVLTLLAVFSRRRKHVYLWGICGVWLADAGWIVWDMVHFQTVRWQHVVNLVEHLLFLAVAIAVSVLYLRLKKQEPDLFKPGKKRFFRKKSYTPKF